MTGTAGDSGIQQRGAARPPQRSIWACLLACFRGHPADACSCPPPTHLTRDCDRDRKLRHVPPTHPVGRQRQRNSHDTALPAFSATTAAPWQPSTTALQRPQPTPAKSVELLRLLDVSRKWNGDSRHPRARHTRAGRLIVLAPLAAEDTKSTSNVNGGVGLGGAKSMPGTRRHSGDASKAATANGASSSDVNTSGSIPAIAGPAAASGLPPVTTQPRGEDSLSATLERLRLNAQAAKNGAQNGGQGAGGIIGGCVALTLSAARI